MEVRNRFKELDLIDRVPDELSDRQSAWQSAWWQDHPQEKEMQKKAKWLSKEDLQIAVKRRKLKAKEKKKDIPIWMQSSKE